MSIPSSPFHHGLLAAALKLLADESTLSPRVAWSIADADG